MDNVTRVDIWLDELRSGEIPPIKVAAKFADLSDTVERDKAFQDLVELLHDDNPWYRVRAVMALGELGDLRAVEPLIEMLKDEDEEVGGDMIWQLFEILSSFKDPKAIQPLIEQLHRVEFKDAWSLFAFGDAAISPMIDALKHTNSYTRWQAANWLGNRHDERAIPALVEATTDSNERVRNQAIYSLGWIRSSKAIPALEKLARESEAKVRKCVAYALGNINDPKVLSVLEELSKDTVPEVRTMAIDAIKAFNEGNE